MTTNLNQHKVGGQKIGKEVSMNVLSQKRMCVPDFIGLTRPEPPLSVPHSAISLILLIKVGFH